MRIEVTGSIISGALAPGVHKPGLLKVTQGGLWFDDFIVGVPPDSDDPVTETVEYLLAWAQNQVGLSPKE